MDLKKAIARIERGLQRMDKAFHRTVFDEWAVVQIRPGQDQVLHSSTAREDQAATFGHDFRILRRDSQGAADNPGDFGFTKEGKGTAIDAFLVLGDHLILILNNTGLSMHEVAQNPLWQAVQPLFFNLSETFRSDPLVV